MWLSKSSAKEVSLEWKHFQRDIFRVTQLKATLIWCKTGLNLSGKTRNIALQQCCKTRCTFLLPVFNIAFFGLVIRGIRGIPDQFYPPAPVQIIAPLCFSADCPAKWPLSKFPEVKSLTVLAPVLRCAWQMKNHHQTKKCFYKILRVGTHYAKRVAATCGGDFLQRQIASCVLETFCENLCGCNRILSPQQVAQCFFFCDLLQRQNSVAETKIFTKGLQHTRSDLSQRHMGATSRPTCTHWVICRQLVA